MTGRTDRFNEGGVITIKDEVVEYLDRVVEASPQVSYTLPEDDEQGQRFEVLISDELGVPKGAINLTVIPFEDGSIISLSSAGDYNDGATQTLHFERVDQILVNAASGSSMDIKSISFVKACCLETSEGFGAVEPIISDVLDKASAAIVSQSHHVRPENVTSNAPVTASIGQVQPVILREPSAV